MDNPEKGQSRMDNQEKGKSRMNNPEKLATSDTQDTGRRQTKTKNTTQKTKKISNTAPFENVQVKHKSELISIKTQNNHSNVIAKTFTGFDHE
jgi:hypothetical protein